MDFIQTTGATKANLAHVPLHGAATWQIKWHDPQPDPLEVSRQQL